MMRETMDRQAQTSTTDRAADGGWHDRGNGSPHPQSAIRDAVAQLGELREYAAYFLATKMDGLKVTVRNILVYAVLGMIGLVAGGAIIVTAAVLVCFGIANALARLSEHVIGPSWGWLGELIVGLGILGGIAAGVIIAMRKLTNTSRKKLVEKYEQRQRKQQSDFGHDVRERAAEQHAGE
jgi:hypothetical protein